MNQLMAQFQWSFPGGLWTLAASLAGGVVLICLSYWLTLTRIPHRARLLLSFLRFVGLVLILACLCRPTIVKQIRSEPDEKPRVAVILDESGSMNIKSLWGRSRRDKALWYWNSCLKKLDEHYELHTFAFAESMRPTKQLDESLPANDTHAEPDKPLNTHLYSNIIDWSEEFITRGYDGVICLTDGVDTSNESPDKALDALQAAFLPHAFVVQTAPLPSLPFVEITKLEVPSTSQVGTAVTANMLVRVSGLVADQPLEVLIKQGEKLVHRRKIPVFGHVSNTQNVSFQVPVPTAETLLYDVQVQSGGETLASAKWTVQGIVKEKPTVLLYQGALDWGTRHLRGVFDRSDSAEMTVRFAGESLFSVQRSENDVDNFPGPTELAQFNVVILLNLDRRHISPRMESTLTEFVRDGGGLLIISGNPAGGAAYSQSELQTLLPVEFAPYTAFDQRVSPGLSQVQRTIRQGNVQAAGLSISFAQQRRHSPPLIPVKLTREGLESPIFSFAVNDGLATESMLPLFESLAPVQRAKVGARVLATDKRSQIVLATQSFGRGRTGVLASDCLWRWRLSLESRSMVFDKFWRQLVGYLCAGVRRQPGWVLDSVVYPPNKTVEVRFHLPHGCPFKLEELVFAAESSDQTLPLRLTSTSRDQEYRTALLTKPDTAYRLTARHQGQVVAEAFLASRAELAGDELRQLKPDRIGLEKMAAASGGMVVEPDRSFDWANWLEQRPSEIVQTQRRALWHNPWIFVALIVLFLSELLIRRRYRMI